VTLRANSQFEVEQGRNGQALCTGEKARINPYHDWRHSGMGWDNGGLTGTDGATGAHCTWKKS